MTVSRSIFPGHGTVSRGLFRNAYEDARRAEAYASIAFVGTYYLAFRDLPALIAEHVRGRTALDFGCGAGRSTRFLRDLGFDVLGVDISPEMLARARERDPEGRYKLLEDKGLDGFPAARFDLVLAAYPFDNIPGVDHRVGLLAGIRRRLRPTGRLILIASTPELYTREWTTFTTAAYPQNALARSGDPVWIVIKEGGDDRPVQDLLWLDDDYRAAFRAARLHLLTTHRPLGREDEPFPWVNETRVPPWTVYVAGPAPAT
jgi:SAM-dependent methyltransferase